MSVKSIIHCIPEGELGEDNMKEGQIESDFTPEELTEVVMKHFNPEDLKVGDVIHFDDYDDYRNSGKVLWGPNHTVIHLADEHDEYGYVPSSLPINLFTSVDYFSDSIDHNNYVWFNCEGYEVKHSKEVGEDENFMMPETNGPHDELYAVPIYEVMYEKKITSLVIGANLYKIYTYDPMTLTNKTEQLLLLTHTDEFGHEFEDPYSLFDTDSFHALDDKYAKYLDQEKIKKKAKVMKKNKHSD
jgi:hypothetical protein